MSKLVFGCGFLGARVARLWCAADETVHVVTRSAERAQEFAAQGLQPVVANILDPQSLGNIPQVDTVLFAVGYERSSTVAIETVYAEGLRNVLTALPTSVERVITISTTGVYGNANGDSVDEQTPTHPQRAGGRASLAAEQILANHPLGKHSVLLRLAGIYGPGRIPYLEKLRAGQPLAVPSAGWLNLIHVDDAAAIVVASDRWAAENPVDAGPEIFCVSDGHPVVRADYYREVARHIQAAEPRFVAPDPASPAASRAESNKRIANSKLVHTLRYELRYPTYREGLAAILGRGEQ